MIDNSCPCGIGRGIKHICSTKQMEHRFYDKDIEKTETGYNKDKTPHTIELVFVEGTEAVLLNRDDVVALAKYFDIVKLM